jgi:hypothetical protein
MLLRKYPEQTVAHVAVVAEHHALGVGSDDAEWNDLPDLRPVLPAPGRGVAIAVAAVAVLAIDLATARQARGVGGRLLRKQRSA